MKKFLFVCLLVFAGCNHEVVSTTITPEPPKTKELLVQTTPPEWWQPVEVKVHPNGSVFMKWSSRAAKDEYDRQQRLQEEATIANAPDDAMYVFDDTYDAATGRATIDRQDNGARNKLGVEKTVNTNHAALMPQFQQIAADNSNRLAAFTGARLTAVQACEPHYWNVTIESVVPITNGSEITVLVTCGSRTNGDAAFINEKWTYVNSQLTLVDRSELISMAPNSY
jgi:hypothetical protein